MGIRKFAENCVILLLSSDKSVPLTLKTRAKTHHEQGKFGLKKKDTGMGGEYCAVNRGN